MLCNNVTDFRCTTRLFQKNVNEHALTASSSMSVNMGPMRYDTNSANKNKQSQPLYIPKKSTYY